MGNKNTITLINDGEFDEGSLLLLKQIEDQNNIVFKSQYEQKIVLELWMRIMTDEENVNTEKEYQESIAKLKKGKRLKIRETIFDSLLTEESKMLCLELEERYNIRCLNDTERNKLVNTMIIIQQNNDNINVEAVNAFHSFIKQKNGTIKVLDFSNRGCN